MSTPIVFVPGLLCSAEVFAAQISALWAMGPITVASTLEGRTIGEIAKAILRDAPPRFALAGISMGGYISMEIMRQAPDRVARLAFLNSSARHDTPEQSEGRRALLSQAQASDFPSWVEAALSALMHPSRHADPALRAVNRRMGVAVGLKGLAQQIEAACSRPDSRSGLAAIRVPALVLAGDADKVLPPELSEEIADLIPNSTFTVVPKCGHSSTLERPEQVSAALIEWMQR